MATQKVSGQPLQFPQNPPRFGPGDEVIYVPRDPPSTAYHNFTVTREWLVKDIMWVDSTMDGYGGPGYYYGCISQTQPDAWGRLIWISERELTYLQIRLLCDKNEHHGYLRYEHPHWCTNCGKTMKGGEECDNHWELGVAGK